MTDAKKKEYLNFTQSRGLSALEKIVDDGNFCVGNSLTVADIFFIAQMRNVVDRFKVVFLKEINSIRKFNAIFQVNIDEFPKCKKLYKNLQKLPIFIETHPTNQPGAGVDPVASK